MKIYTRTGDDGTTGLFGGGRVRKDNSQIAAYGTVDELNSFIGVAASQLAGEATGSAAKVFKELQEMLFEAGADLATPSGAKPTVPRINDTHVVRLEALIDSFEQDLEPLTTFVLPGGTTAAATVHVARTVCRRAERACVAMETEELDTLQTFLNRLSDLLFVMARWINKKNGVEDIAWKP